ncbi:30S ribosomal protein S13 [Neorickettsia helminthoeca str. Oregon]|uniref:Small ribosomal subunit protein uS13 n=1 Tax=Neorickettsia helminthoeca str. Oregon TaxID=1286528 RepID=X5HLG5_9RICK|nr:30S ribosomal protein S13 [Neorickettsia helminthoeca]AHX11230.1 30S ribosomal protein S13 [Neorickettsia helminthoeca str. Oregon]
MRFLGVNLPDNKAVVVALTYIYGVGFPTSRKICAASSVSESAKLSDLQQGQLNAIMTYIKNEIPFEGDLRKSVAFSIKHLMDIKCYRATRHRKNLPVRGQRTRTNARTRKGRVRIPVAAKKRV